MTATATPTLEAAVQKLVDQGATLAEAVADVKKTLEKPDYSALKFSGLHAGEGTVGFWGEGETIAVSVPEGGPKPLPKKKTYLPKGYKNSTWKTGGDFYRDGFLATKEGRQAEFKAKHDSVFKAVQGMSLQQGNSAGYFVLPEFNMNIFDREYANDLWPRTDQYTVNDNMVFLANAETSRATGSRHGGLQGYWIDEGGTPTKSKPTFRRIELSLKRLGVLVYLTNQLIERGGPALEQYVNKKVQQEVNFMLGDVVVNGSGVQQPLGILNSPALLTITQETNQPAGTIYIENIDKMWARRHVSGNYAWYHNQDCGPALDQLNQYIGTGGVPLYRPDGAAGVMPQMLKTAPRIETEFNATLGTVGDIGLWDLSQYITISRGGLNQLVSMEVEFLTQQTALLFTMDVNGRPWETTPVTPYKGSNTQASFSVVETR